MAAAESRLPVDRTESINENTVGSSDELCVALSAEKTRALLQEVPEAYHTQINDILLSALAITLGGFMATDSVLIDLEGHGREDLFEDVNVSRTVGWFTSL